MLKLSRAAFLFLFFCLPPALSAGEFSAGTYNLEFYVDTPTLGVNPKTAEARRIIRQSIKAMNADVIALQELGSRAALDGLVADLKKEGIRYPYIEFVQGYDTNLHVGFISRLPFTAVRHHTNEPFLFQGRRRHVLRGFGEVEVSPAPAFRCTLITTHLKSKRVTPEADQQGIREEEATILREKVEDFFKREPRGNLIVLGDLNDGIATRTLRIVKGRGKTRLEDLKIFENNGDSLPSQDKRYPARRVFWTHYFAKEQTYSRIDFILASPALLDNFRKETSRIITLPDWGAGSDHRPVVAKFEY